MRDRLWWLNLVLSIVMVLYGVGFAAYGSHLTYPDSVLTMIFALCGSGVFIYNLVYLFKQARDWEQFQKKMREWETKVGLTHEKKD